MQAQGGPRRAELWGWVGGGGGVNIALKIQLKLPAKASGWPSK